MAQTGPADLTVEFGNPKTQIDAFDATKLNNGAKNTLGTAYFDNPATLANPNGAPVKYRYVRYLSAANTILPTAKPQACYWTDLTFTTVTFKVSEAWGGQSAFAGVCLINTTDFPGGLSGAQLLVKLGGNYIWIVVAGYVASVASAAAAAGDQLYATLDASTTGGFSKVAVGAATVGRIAAFALAATPSDIFVVGESI